MMVHRGGKRLDIGVLRAEDVPAVTEFARQALDEAGLSSCAISCVQKPMARAW